MKKNLYYNPGTSLKDIHPSNFEYKDEGRRWPVDKRMEETGS
jgi:hypothetical protein